MFERGHARLVVEDAAEMFLVREHLVLQRQEGAAGIDQIDAGQAVFQRHFLRAQMLLHRHREIGAALDRGVVGDHHHFAAVDAADAGDQPGRGRCIVVHAVRGQRREFEEGRARIEQGADALARQQLAARGVLLARLVAAAFGAARELAVQVVDQRCAVAALLAWKSGERGSICEAMTLMVEAAVGSVKRHLMTSRCAARRAKAADRGDRRLRRAKKTAAPERPFFAHNELRDQ